MPRGEDTGHDPRRKVGREDFGLSEREQSEITGKAMGGHIFDAVEDMMGGAGSVRQSYLTEAWSNAHQHFQGHDVRPSDDEFPTMHHDLGNGFEARYPVGGPYIDIHPSGSDGAIEALHVAPEDRMNPEAIKQRAKDFDHTDGYDY
jgi:hypothetical protein